jgi:hypothetical protein
MKSIFRKFLDKYPTLGASLILLSFIGAVFIVTTLLVVIANVFFFKN